MQLTEAAPLYVPAPHDVHADEPRATPVALPAPHSRHELWPDADWLRTLFICAVAIFLIWWANGGTFKWRERKGRYWRAFVKND